MQDANEGDGANAGGGVTALEELPAVDLDLGDPSTEVDVAVASALEPAPHAPLPLLEEGSSGKLGLARSRAWPGNVPGGIEALAVLSGTAEVTPELFAPTQQLLAALTAEEFSALASVDEAPHSAALQRAVTMRWRLSVALAVKPEALGGIDLAALDVLLADADVALSGLKVEEGMEAGLVQAIESARGALARDAVTLSEVGQIQSRTAAATAVAGAAKRYRESGARITSFAAISSEETKAAQRKNKLLYGMLAVAFVVAGGFHGGRRFFAPRPVEAPSAPGLPSGMVGQRDPTSGFTVAQFENGGKKDESAVAQLRATAELSGKGVVEIAPGQFLLGPSDQLPQQPQLPTPARGPR